MTPTGGADAARLIIHATTVSIDGRGVVIMGASGSGKSFLALQLMAFGAALVADDRTILTAPQGHLLASCPETIKGMIEAPGVGLLAANPAPASPVNLVVDMDQPPAARLPEQTFITLLGCERDLILGREVSNLAAIVLQMMKGGRVQT